MLAIYPTLATYPTLDTFILCIIPFIILQILVMLATYPTLDTFILKNGHIGTFTIIILSTFTFAINVHYKLICIEIST